MIFTLMFILFAGLLIKSFYTHYISEKRKYFSFDDRRFTDEDYLKVQDLNIGKLERVFLFIMLSLYVVALLLHIFVNPVMSAWLLASLIAAMLLLSVLVDLRLYTISYDKSHIVMSVIWLAVIIGIFVFLYMSSVDDVEAEFGADAVAFSSIENDILYGDIESIEMTGTVPEIPFNHLVLGIGGHLHGTFIKDAAEVYNLEVEDRNQEMILIMTDYADFYINDEDPEVTESWFNELQSRTGN